MEQAHAGLVGRVVEIRRYPVKSMLGEELNAAQVAERGVLGDRALALIDAQTGKVASAKNPRRWPALFDFRAAYLEPPESAAALPAVRITLPDGRAATTGDAAVEQSLSEALGRNVRLARSAVPGASAEGYWPDHDWLAQRDEVFEFPLPEGTFFDGASVHLLTTSTLDRLRKLFPAGRFEVPRFRPNFVIETGQSGFVENDWIGRTLVVGNVRLRVEGPCPRCIMTTLGQGSLPKDPGILRTVVAENGGNVGVYASVVGAGGLVQRGDPVALAGA